MDSKNKVSIVQYSSEKSTKRKIKNSLNCVQILINAELQIGKKRSKKTADSEKAIKEVKVSS
jgi:hypothetical protein